MGPIISIGAKLAGDQLRAHQDRQSISTEVARFNEAPIDPLLLELPTEVAIRLALAQREIADRGKQSGARKLVSGITAATLAIGALGYGAVRIFDHETGRVADGVSAVADKAHQVLGDLADLAPAQQAEVLNRSSLTSMGLLADESVAYGNGPSTTTINTVTHFLGKGIAGRHRSTVGEINGHLESKLAAGSVTYAARVNDNNEVQLVATVDAEKLRVEASVLQDSADGTTKQESRSEVGILISGDDEDVRQLVARDAALSHFAETCAPFMKLNLESAVAAKLEQISLQGVDGVNALSEIDGSPITPASVKFLIDVIERGIDVEFVDAQKRYVQPQDLSLNVAGVNPVTKSEIAARIGVDEEDITVKKDDDQQGCTVSAAVAMQKGN